jgi:hypothetical protein
MFGKRATAGAGKERYTVFLPVWISENAAFSEHERSIWSGGTPLRLEGRECFVEKRELFSVFRVVGFDSPQEASAFLHSMAVALMNWAVKAQVALRFDPELAEIDTRNEMNRQIRDNLAPEHYGDWDARAGNPITDGGIFPHFTYILPEHRRIWEYPALWGTLTKPVKLSDFEQQLSETKKHTAPQRISESKTTLLAMEAVWLAYGQRDVRLTYILLFTALEILTSEETSLAPWSSEAEEMIKELRKAVETGAKKDGIDKKEYSRLAEAVSRLNQRGIAPRVKALVFRASAGVAGVASEASRSASDKRVDGLYRRRNELVHGAKIRAANNEEFYEGFREALDDLQRLLAQVIAVKMDELGSM